MPFSTIRDDNSVPAIFGVSSVDLKTPTSIKVNPVTGAMFIDKASLGALAGGGLFARTATLVVAASNAKDTTNADYICTGTNDDVKIQAAINALPSNGGTVILTDGVFTIGTTISWAKGNVTLQGQGIDATLITTTSNITAIQIGNRQVDGILRNFNHVFDLTCTVPSSVTTLPAIKIDGGGRGTSIERVRTNGGTYGFELMDLDRCYFANLDANNPITAGIFCEVGLENTYGTTVFINCSMALSNNNTYGLLFGKNSGQASPNNPDRMTFINCLFFMTGGLTGCIGTYFRDVGVTSGSFIGCLWEQNNRQVRFDGAGNSVNFDGCTFLDANTVCTDVFYITSSAKLTVRDCRFQQATNVFNAVSSPGAEVVLEGKSNNQGNITNIWTGSYTSRMGTDTVFAGDTNLVSGLDNQRYDSVFANKWRGNGGGPVRIIPSVDGNNVVQVRASNDSTVVTQVDTQNTRFGIGPTAPGASLAVLDNLYVNSAGLVSKYNGVATAGNGVPSIYGYVRPAQQVNSLVTLATYTVGGADGSFMVSANINVTVATSSLIGVTCTYTDESNTSRSLILNFSNIAGTFATTTTLNTAGAFEGVPLHIRAKTGTTITLETTGIVTTATYTAEGIIQQLA